MEDRLFTEERRAEIAAMLESRSSISVQELSSLFRVSGTTIRQDLSFLESEGILKRTHGGAVPLRDSRPGVIEHRISERAHLEEKKRIAAAALSLIHSGETLLFDSGTTMNALEELLVRSPVTDLTIYSNDLLGMELLEQKEGCRLCMLGGMIRAGFHYTYGPQVLTELRRYHFPKLILATSAIDGQRLSTANSDIASVKRAMMDASDQIILLTDSSKFGTIDFETFGELREADVLITDSGIREEDLQALRKEKLQVIIA